MSDNDELKFSISQPLRVRGGSMSLSHDDYYDEFETVHSRNVDINLTPDRPADRLPAAVSFLAQEEPLPERLCLLCQRLPASGTPNRPWAGGSGEWAVLGVGNS